MSTHAVIQILTPLTKPISVSLSCSKRNATAKQVLPTQLIVIENYKIHTCREQLAI